MLTHLKKFPESIVITDNHLACDIPVDIPIILVHHGCALTTAERNPSWDVYWRDLCCEGQKKMLQYRQPGNTKIISISNACTNDFTTYFPQRYPLFTRFDILHSSEMDERFFKKSFNTSPIILGNWNHLKKGKHLITDLKNMMPEFEFRQLHIYPLENENLKDFNKRKQRIYLDCDIFLQLSSSEGNAYSVLDAMLCGLPVVSTNVGLHESNVPDDCFQKLDWKKCYQSIDHEYIKQKIIKAYKNRNEISFKGRQWYLKNCRFTNWRKQMFLLLEQYK
jgi:glycosyltransferase involved in cell wall biosynthesis